MHDAVGQADALAAFVDGEQTEHAVVASASRSNVLRVVSSDSSAR